MTTDPFIGERVLDRYRLLSVLGRGGAGTVYAAQDERLGRVVALKRLHAEAPVPKAAERMTREAQALAHLRHPHLVTVLDYGVDARGAPVLVMEHIEGKALDVVAAQHPWSVGEIAATLDQILDALSLCHEQGFVHRDLKPANVLLETVGDRLSVQVIDFGIVALVSDHGATALTITGQIFGSLRYMAPEQWRQQDVGPPTDLYAVGLIGYVLLTGAHFITARAPTEILRAHVTAPRPRPKTCRGGSPVPPGFLGVLARATQPDPVARFESAAAMRAALQAWVTPMPRPDVSSPEPPPTPPTPISLVEVASAATLVGPEWATAQTLVDSRPDAIRSSGTLRARLMSQVVRTPPNNGPVRPAPPPPPSPAPAPAPRTPPWWLWLLSAALIGGLVGLAATRM